MVYMSHCSCMVSQDCYETIYFPGIYELNDCMPMQVAVAPSDPTDSAAVQAVGDFMLWVDQMYPSTQGNLSLTLGVCLITFKLMSHFVL